MRLTVFTDYALLVLIYLARHPDRFITITEIAASYGISANHLMKVAQHLASSGEVVTLRGPHGGLRLARAAEAIQVGNIVRGTEPGQMSRPSAHPELSHVLDRAMAAFMAVLNDCTVADMAGAAGSKAPKPDDLTSE